MSGSQACQGKMIAHDVPMGKLLKLNCIHSTQLIGSILAVVGVNIAEAQAK
jgi:hypothetical protein